VGHELKMAVAVVGEEMLVPLIGVVLDELDDAVESPPTWFPPAAEVAALVRVVGVRNVILDELDEVVQLLPPILFAPATEVTALVRKLVGIGIEPSGTRVVFDELVEVLELPPTLFAPAAVVDNELRVVVPVAPLPVTVVPLI